MWLAKRLGLSVFSPELPTYLSDDASVPPAPPRSSAAGVVFSSARFSVHYLLFPGSFQLSIRTRTHF